MLGVDFQIFDCDNHYYEAEDAFSRHIEPEFHKRAMQWALVEGRKRLLVGGRVNRFIPNPTWDPIAQPGSLDEYFRGNKPRSDDIRDRFGQLDPLSEHPGYQDRETRLKLMDEQGIEGAIFFPTLGVGMEQALLGDVPALRAAFRAFNRWLAEDWGFAYDGRIFGAPYVTLADPDAAVKELEWVLENDARFIVMVSGPIIVDGIGRSPADPIYDPFWSLVNEAGITACYHGGDTPYSRYVSDWGESAEMEAFRASPFRSIQSANAIQDTFANLLAHRLFHRFPNLRIASIESGSDWVSHLFEKLSKSFGQNPTAYPEDPRDTFRRHVWVSPHYEDDLLRLRQILGAERIIMGSDYPHAEGLAEPRNYARDLEKFEFSESECRLVMRENGCELSERRAV